MNAAHILALGVLVTTVLLMDLRVLGWGRGLPMDVVVNQLRPITISAVAGALITGLLLFSVRPFEYLSNAAFQIKMALLALALLNAAAFVGFHLERFGFGKILAATSVGLWLSVLVAGRFIGFLE